MKIMVLLVCLTLSVSVFAQTQLVSDNFNAGTNGSPLTNPPWAGCGNATGTTSQLSYAAGTAGGAGYYVNSCSVYTGYGTFPANQYAQATITAATPSSIARAAIQLRTNATPSAQEQYLGCGWNTHDFSGSNFHYRMWNKNAAGVTSLFLSTVAPATNDVVFCEILGATLVMKVNGTTIATVPDNSGITGGDPALRYDDPNGTGPSPTDTIFDNFTAGSGAALTSLVIAPNSATLTAGTYQQFTGTAHYADGTVANLSTWSSSNPTAVEVDPTGLVYGGTTGTVTITGASGTDSGTATVTVTAAAGITPLVHDGFYGADFTQPPGYGYLGPNWTGCGWNGGTYGKLWYNQHQAGGGGYNAQLCAVYTGYGTFPNDQYATATVVAANPTGVKQAMLVVRQSWISGATEFYHACGWDYSDFPGGDYHYRLFYMPAPGTGAISLYLSTIVPQTGDKIYCQILGNTLTMKVNGALIASVNIPNPQPGGYPGMYYITPYAAPNNPADIIFGQFVAGAGPVITSINMLPSSATVAIGSYQQFVVNAHYSDGTNAAVPNAAFTSSNTSAATIDTTGVAYGAGTGSTTIGVTINSLTGSSGLTVARGTPTPSSGLTYITTDPYLNTGAANGTTYNAPGLSADTVLVSPRTGGSSYLWLIYPNPWAVSTGTGTITTNYPSLGSVNINVSLTGAPGNGVDGSPLIQYGCDQWDGCSATGQPPKFPIQLSQMNSLIVDYTYTMSGSINPPPHLRTPLPGNLDVDMIWDQWVCPSSPSTGGPNGGGINGPGSCLEVEVLPYFMFTYGGGGNFIRTFTVPVTLDGNSSTLSFDEYDSTTVGGPNSQQDVLFYPHNLPGLAYATIRFDMLLFLNQAATDWASIHGSPQIRRGPFWRPDSREHYLDRRRQRPNLPPPGVSTSSAGGYTWLMGMEAGTEFGASTTQNYSEVFSKFDVEQTLSRPWVPPPTGQHQMWVVF